MSNPQLSREEFRKRYLASLSNEIKNDAKNLTANQVFRDTGVPSQPVDTRTITEKLADVEGLKQLLRMELNKITDSTSASQIIGQLEAEELRFAYEQFATIERDMKTRFASGVPADIFVSYLRRLVEQFAVTGGVPQTTEEVFAPIAETIKRGSVAKRKQTEGATGEYISKVELTEIDGLTKGQMVSLWKRIKDELYRQLRDEEGLTQDQIDRRKTIYKKITSGGIRSAESIRSFIKANPDDWDDIQGFMSGIAGSGIRGAGLASLRRKRPSGLPPRVKEGMKPKLYGEFGTHLLDLRKLDKGLASFRTSKGTPCKFGVHRVSPCVVNVLKKISGGSIPEYEDIDVLKEDEKIYIADILGKTKLDTKIKMPNPLKSKLQREADRFEILKGQIMAGNDSRELLKEFKILLLKLTKEGRIPKKESNEILYELMVVGL
jgi:hypothetical protein